MFCAPATRGDVRPLKAIVFSQFLPVLNVSGPSVPLGLFCCSDCCIIAVESIRSWGIFCRSDIFTVRSVILFGSLYRSNECRIPFRSICCQNRFTVLIFLLLGHVQDTVRVPFCLSGICSADQCRIPLGFLLLFGYFVCFRGIVRCGYFYYSDISVRYRLELFCRSNLF